MLKSLLTLSGCLLVSTAYADCRVGTITQVGGPEVQLHRADKAMVPAVGLALCQGDHFTTGSASIVNLKLRDGTLITVGRSSDFTIREYHLYKHQPSVALFDLVQGALRGVTGFITQHKHRVEVTTGVATIGIRGTTFWGGYGLTPGGAVDVVMLDGHGVYVKTASGEVDLDQPGQGTTIAPGATPTSPKVWPEAKLARAKATITLDDTPPATPAPQPPAASAP